MRRDDTNHRDAGGPDERLEALVDEALREVAAPPPVNLKPRVMAAWDARARQEPGVADGRPRGGWTGWGFLRPAATVAALLLVVAASLLVWQQVGRPPRGADRAATTSPASPAAKPPAGEAISPDPSIAESPAAALAESAPPSPTPAAPRIVRIARPVVEVEFPVEQVAASLDYLPGAPGAGLGRGVSPLPDTPPLVIAPVQPAPTVSEMSRPVSEFPAGDRSQTPGAEDGHPGQSGGPRR